MTLDDFKDIMAPRRLNDDAFAYMSRYWNPQPAYKKDKYSTPQEIKDDVANSLYMQKIIQQLCSSTGMTPDALRKEMVEMLDEIGLDRKLHVTRWLGILVIKILIRTKTGVFVNERNIFHLKSTMGYNPVIFLPTHRSYGDFILMTYVAFHYDIEFPAVAAGMDFHSMAILGQAMRDTCAFYMRRTFIGAPLYAATFKRYMRELVLKNHSPMEFFVEGTRSRSNKSLLPKFGLLSMALTPLFTQEVSDITIVPVTITYDRLLEQTLFACEHLGIPKPKESTSGFLRAINLLNDSYGNIHINIGRPLSGRTLLENKTAILSDSGMPAEMHELTKEQYSLVQEIGLEVIEQHHKYSIVAAIHLIATTIMNNLHRSKSLSMGELHCAVKSLRGLFCSIGANVSLGPTDADIHSGVEAALKAHGSLIKVGKDDTVKVIWHPITLNSVMKDKMKGYQFSEEVMRFSIPVICLQLYVNPVIHWMLPSAIITLLAKQAPVSKADMYQSYRRLRKLLHNEFPLHEKSDIQNYGKSLEFCIREGSIALSENSIYERGSNTEIIELLMHLVKPFLLVFKDICIVLLEIKSGDDKIISKIIQERVERNLLSENATHPYCASLEVISNCLQSLLSAEGISKSKTNSATIYTINEENLKAIHKTVNFQWDSLMFGGKNNIFMDKAVTSQL